MEMGRATNMLGGWGQKSIKRGMKFKGQKAMHKLQCECKRSEGSFQSYNRYTKI